MLVVKLGGSFVTYKKEYGPVRFERDETSRSYPVKKDILARCAKVLRRHLEGGLIIVHGGGTHGHRTVMRWRGSKSKGSPVMMPWEVRWRMDQLTHEVMSALGKGGIPAFPVPPGNILSADNGFIRDIDVTSLNAALERGMVPILRGDFVPDVSGGWSVVSGDEMIVRLGSLSREAQIPRIDRVVMFMEADGFYSSGPSEPDTRCPRIDHSSFHSNYRSWESGGKAISGDASGGILKKLRAAHATSANGIPVNLVGGDPSRLEAVLSGDDIGTTFLPFEGQMECITGKCMLTGD